MSEVNKIKTKRVKEEQSLEEISKKIKELKKDIPAIQQRVSRITLYRR